MNPPPLSRTSGVTVTTAAEFTPDPGMKPVRTRMVRSTRRWIRRHQRHGTVLVRNRPRIIELGASAAVLVDVRVAHCDCGHSLPAYYVMTFGHLT